MRQRGLPEVPALIFSVQTLGQIVGFANTFRPSATSYSWWYGMVPPYQAFDMRRRKQSGGMKYSQPSREAIQTSVVLSQWHGTKMRAP